MREQAAVCTVHKAALAKIEAASTNFIEIDGETVAVYNFNEIFKSAFLGAGACAPHLHFYTTFHAAITPCVCILLRAS